MSERENEPDDQRPAQAGPAPWGPPGPPQGPPGQQGQQGQPAPQQGQPGPQGQQGPPTGGGGQPGAWGPPAAGQSAPPRPPQAPAQQPSPQQPSPQRPPQGPHGGPHPGQSPPSGPQGWAGSGSAPAGYPGGYPGGPGPSGWPGQGGPGGAGGSTPARAPADKGALVRAVLHGLALVLVVLGVSIPMGQDSLWSASAAWAGFACAAALAQGVAALPSTGGSRTNWQVGAVGAGALVLFWTLIMLPAISSNMAFMVTLGTGCAVAAVLLHPHAPGRESLPEALQGGEGSGRERPVR